MRSQVCRQSNKHSIVAFLEKCPPCFNCQLDAFNCGHFGECSNFDGQCKCPPGWAGIDCLTPRKFCNDVILSSGNSNGPSECDSLADGKERRQREDGKQCECKEGWGGVNCNGMIPKLLYDSYCILKTYSLQDGRCLCQFPSVGETRT